MHPVAHRFIQPEVIDQLMEAVFDYIEAFDTLAKDDEDMNPMTSNYDR